MALKFTLGLVDGFSAGSRTQHSTITVNKQDYVCPPEYAAGMLAVAADARRGHTFVTLEYEDSQFPLTITAIRSGN